MGLIPAPVYFCLYCGRGVHRTDGTDWCECGWWDALPDKIEAIANGDYLRADGRAV